MKGLAAVLLPEGRMARPERIRTMLRVQRRGSEIAHLEGVDGILLGVAGDTDSGFAKHDASGSICIVDGRIDNASSLDLGTQLSRAPGRTTAGVVLATYLRWGVSGLDRLVGDFACVLWDGPEQRLVAARDLTASRPLVWAPVSDGGVVVASSPAGVLASGLVSREVDRERLADYLVDRTEGCSRTVTFFRDISRIGAGETLSVSRGGEVTHGVFGELTPRPLGETLASSELADGFREVLTQAVRDRMASDLEVGAMLSGGMDSSSLVALARERQPGLKVLSAMSRESAAARIESQAIEAVVEQGGIEHIVVSPEEVARSVSGLRVALRETTDLFDSSIHAVEFPLYQRAAASGLGALLDGLDGDVLTWLDNAPLSGLIRRGSWSSAASLARSCGRSHQRSSLTLLALGAVSALLPDGARTLLRARRWPELARTTLRDSVASPELIEVDRMAARLEAVAGPSRAGWTPRSCHLNDVSHPQLHGTFERYERVASFHGVVALRPMFDRRVVEFCLGLPWREKALGGLSKPVMRRAMEGTLPDSVLGRHNLEHVGRDFSRASWSALQPRMQSFVEDRLPALSNVLDQEVVQASFTMFSSEEAQSLSSEDWVAGGFSDAGWRLWKAFTLGEWLENWG